MKIRITRTVHLHQSVLKNTLELLTPYKGPIQFIFDLEPYFKYTECNLCHHNRLLISDGIYILDPYIGHRF